MSNKSTGNNSLVKNILQETLGNDLSNVSAGQLQSFIAAIETYCQSNELLIGLGKSLHSASLVLIVVDPNMRVIVWNGFAATTTGFTPDEVKGRHIIQEVGVFTESTAVTFEAAYSQCSKGLSVHGSIMQFKRKDGSILQMLCNFSPFICGQRCDGVVLIAHDVSSAVPSSVSNAATADTPVEINGQYGSKQAPPYSRFQGWKEVGPDYVIESVLGQGSYGQVAKAKHMPSGEIVAIKKIQNVFADPIDAKRILREMCIVRQLDHPNLVQIKEILRPKDMENFNDLYVVFEYLPTDLEKLLHSPQFLTAEHVRWLVLDLLKALKYMHSANIVHRDLKPANVLLKLSPVAIKICDFGLARGLDGTISRRKEKKRTNDHSNLEGSGSIHPRTPRQRIQRQLTEHVVTRWYRAPEIIFRAHDYSTEIDVWSVGCIFAELLSMQQSSVPSHYNREPLFPGVSCFPLSPGCNSPALPQDSRDQLNVILDVLGTMAEEDINNIDDPDVRTYLRSLSPRPRKSFKELYSGAEDGAIDLLTWMLQMNPQKRATVDDALGHSYLESIRNLEEEIVAPGSITLDFDEKQLLIPEIRKLIQQEIRYYHPDPDTNTDKKPKTT